MTSLRFGELEEARREFAAALELNGESTLARRGLEAAGGGGRREGAAGEGAGSAGGGRHLPEKAPHTRDPGGEAYRETGISPSRPK